MTATGMLLGDKAVLSTTITALQQSRFYNTHMIIGTTLIDGAIAYMT
jgi:hypothetical protein